MSKLMKAAALTVVGFAATILVAALVVAVLVSTARAEEVVWSRWGVEPYATSMEDACRKAPAAIDGFDLPQEVKDALKQAVGTNCDGEDVWLTPGDQLDQMWAGGAKPHVMNNVTVAELPVARSPDGRSYRKGTVAEAAKARVWKVEVAGRRYYLYLPYVCGNWSQVSISLPQSRLATTPALQPLATTPAPLRKPGNCTGRYTFVVNVWDKNKVPPELLQEAEAHMKAAKVRDTRAATHHPGYATDAFSRTVGPRIRKLEEQRIKDAHQAAAAASAPFVLPPSMRAQGSWVIGLYFRDPKSDQLLEGGRVKVQTMIQVTKGLGEIDFTETEVANIIETTYPASFLSPEKSGDERRIVVFPYGHSLRSEWWEYEEGTRNRVRSCRYHVHALVAGS